MVGIRSVIINLLRAQKPPKGQVQIGPYSSGVPFILSFFENDKVRIGKFCSIAADSVLIPSGGHIPPRGYEEYRVSTFPLATLKKHGWRKQYNLPEKDGVIIVRNDVWIGARAIILSGVTIGNGAIVGAGAVVTHDVPPYAVVAGVPAKIIHFRYSQDQIDALLKIGWWDWSLEKIKANMDYFYGKINIFIEKFSTLENAEKNAFKI